VPALGQELGAIIVGEDDGDGGVLQHPIEALGRIVGVERDVLARLF
jgi:hypothetical protein